MTYVQPLLLMCSVLGGLLWALLADGVADACGTTMAALPLLVIVSRVARS